MAANPLIRRLAPILSRDAPLWERLAGAASGAALGDLGHFALTRAMGAAYSNVCFLPAVAVVGIGYGFRGVAAFYVFASVLWWRQWWGHVPDWPSQFATFSIGVLMVGFFVALMKSTAQVLDEERRALVESQRRYDARINASPQQFWATDARGVSVERSRNMGAHADWIEAIHPEDRPTVQEAWAHALSTRAPLDCEYRYPAAEGWAWMRSTAVFDEAGDEPLWYGATEDIDARKQAEAARALLMREIDHRARNILSVVQALVRTTPRVDAETFAKALESRVLALAGAHSLLAKSHWRGADVRTLLEQELKSYQGACRFEGPPTMLSPALVQPLALVVHELSTNAAKYGALSLAGGAVTVTWELAGADVAFTWCERGGPPSKAPARKGFGTKLIAGSVKDLVQDWTEDGLTARFRLKDAVAA